MYVGVQSKSEPINHINTQNCYHSSCSSHFHSHLLKTQYQQQHTSEHRVVFNFMVFKMFLQPYNQFFNGNFKSARDCVFDTHTKTPILYMNLIGIFYKVFDSILPFLSELFSLISLDHMNQTQF